MPRLLYALPRRLLSAEKLGSVYAITCNTHNLRVRDPLRFLK